MQQVFPRGGGVLDNFADDGTVARVARHGGKFLSTRGLRCTFGVTALLRAADEGKRRLEHQGIERFLELVQKDDVTNQRLVNLTQG